MVQGAEKRSRDQKDRHGARQSLHRVRVVAHSRQKPHSVRTAASAERTRSGKPRKLQRDRRRGPSVPSSLRHRPRGVSGRRRDSPVLGLLVSTKHATDRALSHGIFGFHDLQRVQRL